MPKDLHISYRGSLKLIQRFWTTNIKKKFSQLSHSQGQLITQQCIQNPKLSHTDWGRNLMEPLKEENIMNKQWLWQQIQLE